MVNLENVPCSFMNEKIMERVIREMGKEYPRKNVSS
jgi:hypothetical protein